jgi:hypothetical protein
MCQTPPQTGAHFSLTLGTATGAFSLLLGRILRPFTPTYTFSYIVYTLTLFILQMLYSNKIVIIVPEYRVLNVIHQEFDKNVVRAFFPGRAAAHI